MSSSPPKTIHKSLKSYRKKRDEGFCTRCGKMRDREGAFCSACTTTRRSTYQRRKELGQCVGCGGEPMPGRVQCASCYEKKAAYHRRLKQDKSLLLKVIAGYGGACQCCGETNPLFLTIDHVNGRKELRHTGESYERRSDYKGERMYRWAILNGFPDELQLLCFNCNCGRQRNGGVCPHVDGKIVHEKAKPSVTITTKDHP